MILLNSSLKSSAPYSEMPWIVIQESLKRECAKGSLKNSNRYHLLGDILVFQKNALSALVRSKEGLEGWNRSLEKVVKDSLMATE